MAWSWFDRLFGGSPARCLRAVRCGAPLRRAGRPHRRPVVLPVRRGSERRAEAAPVQGFRYRLHAGDAGRGADGVVGGRLRRVLPLRREGRMRTVTLSHGGGGKAMKDLIDAVFVAAFDNPL